MLLRCCADAVLYCGGAVLLQCCAVVDVVGNLLQDLLYVVLDPRKDYDEC